MLVTYLLDISDDDPVKTETALIKTKSAEFPDIDTDFEDAQRELVKEYLIEKYGEENVASIAAFGRMRAKAVIKDICRVKNVPYEEVDVITKLIDFDEKLGEAYKRSPQIKQFFDKYEYMNLYELCSKLEGNVRHVSMHAAGLVISPQGTPLTDIVGIEKARGNYVTCWEEGGDRELSKVGLVKIDLLGLSTLTVIKVAMKMIAENHGNEIDIDNIDINDRKVIEQFYKANTLGVFQFERQWIRNLLKKIKITSFSDIAAVNALNRPGPLDAGMDEKFWKIKNGFEQPSYLHPLLEPILKDTYCVILYQEQVMEIAQKLAGFALDEADTFRSVLSKGKADLSKGINPFEKYETKFIEGCRRKGITGRMRVERVIKHEKETPVTAENVKILEEGVNDDGEHFKRISCDVEVSNELFDQIKAFARYGFNKSHSVEYGFISYQCMYLKTYYPHEFMASMLTNTPNTIDQKERLNKFVDYFYEAKRMGIKVLPPDINKSERQFTTEGTEILSGFGFIKSLGDKAIKEILEKRPFKTFEDFIIKVNGRVVNKSAVFALVHSGCFDKLIDVGNDINDLPKRFDVLAAYIRGKKDKKTELPHNPKPVNAIEEEAHYCGDEIFNSLLNLVDKKGLNTQFAADDKIMMFPNVDKMNVSTKIRVYGKVVGFVIKATRSGGNIAFLSLKNGSLVKKFIIWDRDVRRIQRDNDLLNTFSVNNVITCRVERVRDYNNQKSFIVKLDGVKKLI